MKLTKNQKRAVHFKDGNALINAGSGSGKTAVITARIANLIANEKVKPEEILALTFTREATDNMRSRLSGMVGKGSASAVEISTFHSFAYRIMKNTFPEMYKGKQMIQGWWKMSTLYDIVSSKNKNNEIGLGMDIRAGELGSFVSYQKANMVTGGMSIIIDDNVPYVKDIDRKTLQNAFDIYCEHVKNARLIEFDDMLVDFYYKLKADEKFRERISNRYKYVLVDEFQDTNSINLEIIKIITDNNLFVVGDFRQGIYGFINANISNILDFSDTFENVDVIELNDNFRSTDNIVSFINDIIDKSPIEKYKSFSHQTPARSVEGNNVGVTIYANAVEESSGVLEKIQNILDNNSDFKHSDFAILTRTNAEIGIYESIFAEAEIPVDVSNTRSFFDRKEIADILAYATHALEPNDDMSIRRVVNSPSRYISKSVIANIEKSAYDTSSTFEEACEGFSGWGIENLLDTFGKLRTKQNLRAKSFLEFVYRTTRYEDFLNKTSKTHSELNMKIDSINRLFQIAGKFPSIKAFLVHVSIIKSNSTKSKDGVRLLTVHASKGLEFRHVFVPSSTMDNYPHDMCQDVEEERRLFYVACSRAKDTLDISLHVFSGDNSESILPSPFLKDVVGDSLTEARRLVSLGGQRVSENIYDGSSLVKI